jgi:hypothetical protein
MAYVALSLWIIAPFANKSSAIGALLSFECQFQVISIIEEFLARP